ncbi:ABC transporter substrate-binding protein [Paenibacillus montanisoli]|uniref:ABC transporter substrate-binding protein n=2 Tax=Paenibacillus montanisoli TaxID=2081970 RepID=A0A328U1S0_9BACL|nr:ABC transporter substrate-binding protein [Paenibacillus montanisoli]
MKRLNSFTALILLLLLVTACGQTGSNNQAETPAANTGTETSKSADGSITVEDATGTVTLTKRPERIITMEFSFADALATLGVQPVGAADDDDPALFMDEVKSKLTNYTSVGSRYEPNIEVISSLQPDLIIVDLVKHKEVMEQLKGIAPLLVLDDYQADYEQMLKNYMIIAKAVGKKAEGQKRLEEHEAKIADAKSKLQSTDLKVLPAVVNPKGFFAHSDHAYTGSFLAKLGFTDPVKDENSYPQLTLEQLVETNPQVLFLMPTEKETIVNQWEANSLWNKIDAVANKKVFTVERRDWSLARGLIGSEKMASDIVNSLGK